MIYSEYLQTDHWKKTAKEHKLWAGGKCQLCNAHEFPLNVHHRDPKYKSLWHESHADLLCLCEPCHHTYHMFNGIGKDYRNCGGAILDYLSFHSDLSDKGFIDILKLSIGKNSAFQYMALAFLASELEQVVRQQINAEFGDMRKKTILGYYARY